MKARVIHEGEFRGVIRSVKEYEKIKNEGLSWATEKKIATVEIPYDLFKRLMLLDAAVDKFSEKAKAKQGETDDV
jgi:hypothetical protein